MTLSGKNILVTRPRHQVEPLKTLLEQEGGTVVFQPVIEILPVENSDLIERYITGLTLFSTGQGPGRRAIGIRSGKAIFDWLIFSSPNGVDFFLDYWESTRYSSERGERIRIAAMGPGTAEALARHGLTVDAIPEVHRAEGMVELLRSSAEQGGRFLSIRGDRGRDLIAKQLTQSGGHVEELTVYRNLDLTEPSENVLRLLESGCLDAVTVTSSSIAQSLIRMFGEGLQKTRLVTISELTSKALTGAGFTVASQAGEATIASLVAAVIFALREET